MKIAAGNHIAAVWEHQRVVGRARAFNREYLLDMCEGVANSPMHLWNTPNTISVLDSRIIFAMRFANFTATQQFAHMFPDRDLARVRSRALKTRIKGTRRSHQSFQCHGTCYISDMGEAFRTQQG